MQPQAKLKRQSFLTRAAYAIFQPVVPYFRSYREIFRESGIPLTYEAYMATILFVSTSVLIASFLLAFFLHVNILNLAFVPSMTASVVLASTAFAAALFIGMSQPLYKRRAFRRKIDSQMPYSFGFMGVLASAGLAIERLFERVAQVEVNPYIAEFAKRFVRDVKLFGLDTQASLRDVGSHSPSQNLRKIVEGIAVAARTSGDLRDLLVFEARRLLNSKREQLRKTLSNLTVMGEMYVALLVVGPIIFILMLSILSLLGGSGGFPLSSIDQINLVIFVGIPVLGSVFLVILDSFVGGEA